MGRPSIWIAELGLPPLRDCWRDINRQAREAQAQKRAEHHARDAKRAKCRCDAYKFPHRPGGESRKQSKCPL